MDGAKARVRDSLQVWLSLAASVVIILLAIVGGALSFFEAYGDAGEVQDEQLRAVSQAFGLHGLPLPAAAAKGSQSGGPVAHRDRARRCR